MSRSGPLFRPPKWRYQRGNGIWDPQGGVTTCAHTIVVFSRAFGFPHYARTQKFPQLIFTDFVHPNTFFLEKNLKISSISSIPILFFSKKSQIFLNFLGRPVFPHFDYLFLAKNLKISSISSKIGRLWLPKISPIASQISSISRVRAYGKKTIAHA